MIAGVIPSANRERVRLHVLRWRPRERAAAARELQ
jgi:hypothetical protein